MSSLILAATDWTSWIVIGALVVILVVMLIFSTRRNKKRQEEAQNLMNAVKPGNKVKTIGGVCGIVVEVDNEEGTFVLETGSENSGKCFMKFDKQAIYQTDAVAEKSKEEDKKSEEEQKPAPEEPFQEVKTEEAKAEASETASAATEEPVKEKKTVKGKKNA